MAKIETKNIRNVALLGHGGSGKTSLAEAMLYITNGTDRLGNVPAGNTVCDYDSEEIARHFSISAATAPVMWKDVKINIIDTPGYLDFAGEVGQALRVADSAIIVVDGKAGIEVGTELAWDAASAAGLPTAFFINKFDDNEARFGRVLDALHLTFGKQVCPLTIPMVRDGVVVGAIDLIDKTAHVFDKNGRHSVELIPEARSRQDRTILTTSPPIWTGSSGCATVKSIQASSHPTRSFEKRSTAHVWAASAAACWAMQWNASRPMS